MLDSDDCTLSLDNLFFEKPAVPKVELLDQKAHPWLIKEPPPLSQIPATQDLVQEVESLSALYSFSQEPQVFQSSFKGPAVQKVFPSSSFCSFSDNDKENKETWGNNQSNPRYDNPGKGEGFMAFLSGTCQRGANKDENFHGSDSLAISSDLSLDCIKIPPLRRSLFKVQVLSCGGDSSNTDDLSSSQAASRPQTFLSHVTMATVPPPPPQPLRATVIQAAPPFPPKAGFSPPPLGSTAASDRPSPQTTQAEMQDKGTKRAFVPPMTPQPLHIQGPSGSGILRPVSEIPSKFRSVFEAFPFFNYIQSKALDDILYTDKNFVACAPTGSGKTVLFELAIIHLLMKTSEPWRDVKAVYLAPIKALCGQCFESWNAKFGPLGVNCKELTGDTEIDNLFEIQDSQIILTTPEKWDSMTRKWRDNCLLQLVRLILIDEVHVVKDATRGATLEVVVSRMKAIHSYRMAQNAKGGLSMRFVAVSATIPNVCDVADWLSDQDGPATYLDMDESHRPVKLKRVVLGFPCSSNQTEFKFDLTLNYKMANIIQTYSNQKPTLVFCSTRKGVQQAATVLAKDTRFVMSTEHKQRLMKYANSILDSKLRDLVTLGVGYHHAGVDTCDRKLIEQAFTLGDLPVLFTTRTLAMGVNLPAHLVVIKSTMQYVAGACEEYSEADLLQMIGRAGRPQFDTSATAVIMTKFQTKDRYMKLMNGMEIIESSLHSHLMEHLNAEIALRTISDVNMALDWIRSTFLYIRALKNPVYYGFSADLDRHGVESKLQELCLKNLNSLTSIDLIDMDEDINIKPTEAGKLMARYCVAFDTMKQFSKVAGMENLSDLIDLVSKAKEFSEIQLRVNEKRSLNTMNRDKNRITIRYPMEGKIKTSEMKVNCLIQAHLGSIAIQEFGLTQDTAKIFRNGIRIVRCLSEFLSYQTKRNFCALLNALILAKCFRAKLWEDSPYVSKQLEKIGQTLSTAMVNAGLTTFRKIEQTNPRELELIVNRHPPFGNQIREFVIHLPKYEVTLEQLPRYSCTTAEIVVYVVLKNHEQLASRRTATAYHFVSLLIGDSDNAVVLFQKIQDSVLLRTGSWSKRIAVTRASSGDEISVNLISSEYVGLDVQQKQNIYYSGARKVESDKMNKTPCDPTGHKPQQAPLKQEPKETPAPQRENTSSSSSKVQSDMGNRRSCNHLCKNKEQCGHNCCKVDGNVRERQKRVATQESTVSSHLKDLWSRCDTVAQTPAKRLKMKMGEESGSVNMQEFSYKAPQKLPSVSRYRSSHYEDSDGPPTVTVDLTEDCSQLSNPVHLDSFYSEYDEFAAEGTQEMMDDSVQDHAAAHGHQQGWIKPEFSASGSQRSQLPTNSISPSHSAVPKKVSAVSNQCSHGNKQLSAQIPRISFDLGNEWDDWGDFDYENLRHATETSSSFFAPAEVLQSVKRTMPGTDIMSAPALLSLSQVNPSTSSTRMPMSSVSPTTNPAMQNPSSKTVRPLNRHPMDWNKQTPDTYGTTLTVATPVEPAATQIPPLNQRFDFFSTMAVPANSTMTGNTSIDSKEEEAFLGIFDGIF